MRWGQTAEADDITVAVPPDDQLARIQLVLLHGVPWRDVSPLDVSFGSCDTSQVRDAYTLQVRLGAVATTRRIAVAKPVRAALPELAGNRCRSREGGELTPLDGGPCS